MAKLKYRFNPEKLTFDKYKPTRLEWFVRIGGLFSAMIITAFLSFLFIFKYIDSPKEKELKRELKNAVLNYELLSKRIENLELVAKDLENRDENIYRSIFEADPIPLSIRNAGYGGIEKYEELTSYANSKLIINTTKNIDKLARKLYVLSKSFDEISQLAASKEQMLACIPAIQPVANKFLNQIASGFGWRLHPIYKVPRFHDGLDFSGRRGSDVYSTGDGKVEKVEYSRSGYGNCIIINHGYGYKTLYAHLDRFLVRPGQTIKRGEPIGTLGNTGLSTAPHLHYEVIKNGIKINPINFFSNDLSPADYEKIILLAEQANQALD